MGYPGDQLPPRQPPPSPFAPPPGRRGSSPYGNTSPYGNAAQRPYGAAQQPHGEAPQQPHGNAQQPYGNAAQRPYDNAPRQPYGGRPYEPAEPPRGAPPYENPYGNPQPQNPGGEHQRARREEIGQGSPYADQRRDRAGGTGETAAQPPRPETAWDPYAPAPLWRRPIVLGGALLAMIGALFLGLWVAARSEKPPPPRVLPTPTTVIPEVPKGKYGFAGSRATDKMPLTIKEIFGAKKFRTHGRSYVMTVRRKEKRCDDGVTGENIKKALKAGKCTQLIRASFADTKGTIIGTVGVANLRTSTHAKKVTTAGGGGERKDYLKPLPGTDEATKHLGGVGEAYAGGWAYGHYAVLLWFQFKDGHAPSKSELKRLYQAATDITDKTVFPALEHRSLTGHRN